MIQITDTLLLKNKVEESGLKYMAIASSLGISYAALKRKIDNKSYFTAKEIYNLCSILNIDLEEKERIFFAKSVYQK